MQHGERKDDMVPCELSGFDLAVIANALMSTAKGLQTHAKALRRDFKQKEAAETVRYMGEVNATLERVKTYLPNAGEAVKI